MKFGRLSAVGEFSEIFAFSVFQKQFLATAFTAAQKSSSTKTIFARNIVLTFSSISLYITNVNAKTIYSYYTESHLSVHTPAIPSAFHDFCALSGRMLMSNRLCAAFSAHLPGTCFNPISQAINLSGITISLHAGCARRIQINRRFYLHSSGNIYMGVGKRIETQLSSQCSRED